MEKRFKELSMKYKEEEKLLKAQHSRISFLRLFSAIACILFFWSVFVDKGGLFYLVGGVLSLVLFIYLIVLHKKIGGRLAYASNMAIVNEKYVKRIKWRWFDFKDIGEEFIDDENPYTSDLDIFGERSLFQLINITNSFFGRNRLASLLNGKNKEKDQIELRQGAVKELSDKLTFSQEIECVGINNFGEVKGQEDLLKYLQESKYIFKNKSIRIIFYLLPLATIGSFLYAITFNGDLLFVPSLLLVLHGILLMIGNMGRFSILKKINKFKGAVESYYKLINIIETTEFSDEYLKSLKIKFYDNNIKASKCFKDISKILDKIDARYNMIGFLCHNLLLLGDYHCAFLLDDWKEKYGGHIEKWFNIVGEFEALASLGVIININEKATFPNISNDEMTLNGESIGHMLINPKDRICNEIKLDDSIFVITGSNMSGKTTFLRTIGINLVLAYAGAPVCAEKFNCSIMNIYTSMRISDDLSNGISTFYAELKRIKIIIDNVKNKRPMIFFIDEIFRGTNSQDRILGAKSVLMTLNKPWIMGMISTHDFELCELNKYERVKNYHFEEYYDKDTIRFDYKIKHGVCTTRNAKYLMKMVGIDIRE